MASIINRINLKAIQGFSVTLSPFYQATRGTAMLPRRKPKVGTVKLRNLIKSDHESLKARGFLRSQKSYQPPDNVVGRVKEIIKATAGTIQADKQFNPDTKFKVLNACFTEFNHCVPNSMLLNIETPSDVLNFYSTPVTTTTPYDELKRLDLPPNLHVQSDYLRFNPETDTKFGGITAFPETSTLVTGLKYKKKYKGHKQRLPKHYDTWSDYIEHDPYKV